jgi:CRP-like cAMP-binding protein
MRLIPETAALRARVEAFRIPQHFSHWARYTVQYLTFAAGEEILAANEPVEGFYFLLTGQMRIYALNPDGKVCLLTLASAGEQALLGDIEYLENCPSPNQVEAVSACTLLRVRYDRPLMATDLQLYRFLAGMLVRKMSAASEGTKRRTLYPLPQRFADFLLTASTDGVYTGSYGDAAAILGVSYRQLMRVVRRFYDDGLISRTSGAVHLLAPEKLRELRGDAQG